MPHAQAYGDLTVLNADGLIRTTVGTPLLADIDLAAKVRQVLERDVP